MIKLVWRLLLVCCALLIMVYGIAFSYSNSALISLDLIFHTLPALPVGMLILISIFTGFLLSLAVSSLSIVSLRTRNRQLNSKIARSKTAMTQTPQTTLVPSTTSTELDH